jgi:hypothetical protein
MRCLPRHEACPSRWNDCSETPRLQSSLLLSRPRIHQRRTSAPGRIGQSWTSRRLLARPARTLAASRRAGSRSRSRRRPRSRAGGRLVDRSTTDSHRPDCWILAMGSTPAGPGFLPSLSKASVAVECVRTGADRWRRDPPVRLRRPAAAFQPRQSSSSAIAFPLAQTPTAIALAAHEAPATLRAARAECHGCSSRLDCVVVTGDDRRIMGAAQAVAADS